MADTKPDDRAQFKRMHSPGDRPWYVRLPARLFCHLLVWAFLIPATVAGWLRRPARRRASSEAARVVLTGTAFADNWVEAMVRPVAAPPRCQHLWIVADHPFIPMEKVTYVCPPRWLQRLIGRVPARSLLFVIVALRRRPDAVGGFHLLVNGLLALAVARVVRARAMWFCVGGWAEFVGGGVHGGNQVFNRIARDDSRLERLLLAAIHKFDLILTMGTGARDYLRQCGVTSPVEVMPGGIDLGLSPTGDQPRPYDLITVSRIVPVKRLDVFLNVVRQVADRNPQVKAVVVGDGEELPRMKRLAQDLKLTDHVDFVGHKTNVSLWLIQARVFVLTSDSEGLTLALIEAMLAGLPAVVSDVGDLGDLVHDGTNGWRVPPGTVDEFADRISTLLSDNQLYDKFAAQAQADAQTCHVDAITDRWDAVFAGWGFDVAPPPAAPRHGLTWSRRGLWKAATAITRRPEARILSAVKPQVWLGGRFRRTRQFLQQAQQWTREQADAHQLARLQQIISLAYHRSPYYRRSLRACGFEPDDLKSIQDLGRLPIIDAQTVRAHLRAMCTIPQPERTADYLSTGGTGGKPLFFFINADRSVFEYAHLVVSWQRIGFTLGLPLAVFRGRVIHGERGHLRHEYDPMLRHHHYSTFHMTDENMGRYLEHVRSLGPCYLHVYPSAIAALGRFVRRSGIDPPANIRGIIAESEIVYPEQREMVEQVFGCRYFSCYGHTEKLIAAAECEHSPDYHVWPTYGYFELLDEQGNAVTTEGQRGEIVGTGFINRVVPFIRYRTGDWATYVGDHCPACGRQQTIIRDIRGHRTQEVLIAADGSQIPWAALNMHDDTFAHVRQFQFYQDTPGEAQLRIVPADGLKDSDRRRILRNLAEKLDGRINVTLESVDEIPLSAPGKAVYVDQGIEP